MYAQLLTFGAAFLGSAVESIEALTIVLAVGLTRGWKSPLYGTLAALASLVVLVLAFGQLITTRVPETTLKLVIGTLILLFGLRWLHKAILRSAGVIALHDENEEFNETIQALEGSRDRTDWLGFTIAFKGVFLEGVEVAFIVFAVGANSHNLPIAALGGIAAMLAVAAIGVVVRHPLANVPENTLKYSVGLILASLGTFWAAEGMGTSWPLDFVSILGLGLLYYLASRIAVTLIRGRVQAPLARA
ncbi:MAG: COG4280 domain-containing protein [Candidatus Dormibacteria bacterium]